MKFIVMLLCALAFGQVNATTDVELAKEARKILWKLPNVGRGQEIVCRIMKRQEKKVGKITVVIPERKVCKTVEYDNVVLAVKQPLLGFKLVRARMDTCTSLDEGFETDCVRNYLGNTNGLNTHFVINRPFGYKVYAIRRLGNTPEGRQEMVYSPFSFELNTPLVIAEGRKYLDRVIENAISELRREKVQSLAFPEKLVADVVRRDVVHSLALIEHMDPIRFAQELAEKHSVEGLTNEVYTTLALNQEGAYSLAPSLANANGLYQVIPRTYHSMVVTYPAARLIFNYRAGTHHHVNAAKTAMLLLDHDLSLLRPQERKVIHENRLLGFGFYASTFNGGPSCPKNVARLGLCAIQLYRTFGEFVKNNPNEENSTYVQKMYAVANLR